MSLDKYPTEELESELALRKAKALDHAINLRKDHNNKIVTIIDDLKFISTHDRTTCSDISNINAYDGCNRCTILSIADLKYMDDEWELDLNFVRRPLA